MILCWDLRGKLMLKIRPARKKDAKDLATINILGWKTTYRGLVPDELLDTRTVTEKRIERFEEQILKCEIFLVAENEKGTIGYLSGGKSRDDVPYEYEMYAFYVHPDFQRAGVGTTLFNIFKEKIKGASFCVYALDGNIKGINFYQKMGGVRHFEFDKDQEVYHYMIHELCLAFKGEK